jgi:nucleoid DNA-binding protein
MPYTPPIKIVELKKRGYLKETDFFQWLSEKNNYVELKVVKKFYEGLMVILERELGEKGIISFPGFGTFALVKQKSKQGWSGQYRTKIDGKYVLKFYPSDKCRKVFRRMEKRQGIEGRLDPREKLLNETL